MVLGEDRQRLGCTSDLISGLWLRRIYQFYNHAFKIGVDYQYSAPYAGIYRGMAIVAANGSSLLHFPKALSGVTYWTAGRVVDLGLPACI